MFRNILVLCTANICRSPLAEGLLRLRLKDRPDVRVHSAGVAALEGSEAHPIVLELLREAGLDLSTHRARQCDLALLRHSDLVLVMEQSHLKWLSSSYPQFHGRSFLIGHWRQRSEVPDPIGQPRAVFEAVRDQIELCADDWLGKILK
ncbi:MAG TPA: low molecular weight protein-tyrosine-phosphatase [Nevskiales bacterium]|nr:low molecular weight protein-tyrosine-phosphatase [Nevskiales bacterium]